MATITATAGAVSMASKYTCTHTVSEWDSGGTGGDFIQDKGTYASSPSIASATLTFSYTLPENEAINMAVLQMTATSNTYGGSLYVNDEEIYLSGGKYTLYLDSAIIGTTNSNFTLTFKTNTPTHRHSSNYDSKSTTMGSSDSSGTEYVHTYKKSHTGVLELDDITLKIYTGDDFISAPSTSALFVGANGVAKKVTDMFVGVSGIAKKISDAWIGVNGIARKFWPCLELKDVPAGSIIQLDEAGNGTLVDYIVVAQNHYLNETNTEGHTVFMRKNILNTESSYGNNSYGESYVGEELDTYVNETWKASLDGRIITKLMDITIPCTQWNNPYKTTAKRQVWVPARAELDNSEDWATKYEAPCFAYFENITTNAERIAYDDSGTATIWWTRSCVEGTVPYVRVVGANGAYANHSQTKSAGVRPVFCLPNSLPVSKIAKGQYDLIL